MEGFVDYRGCPASHSETGGWTAALFLIWVEVAERFAYYGVSCNLITYLTGPLGQSTAAAAANVNAWNGASSLLPLLCGFLADAYVGRFRMIVLASMLYVTSFGFLTLFAGLPSLRPPECTPEQFAASSCPSPSLFQVSTFFFLLYLMAVAQSCHKPSVQAFGADQFDSSDPAEGRMKSSFFNWWYFSMCFGIVISLWVVTYIQDNVSWVWGFGLPGIAILVGFLVMLLGMKTYRYPVSADAQLSSLNMGYVFRCFQAQQKAESPFGSEPLLVDQSSCVDEEKPSVVSADCHQLLLGTKSQGMRDDCLPQISSGFLSLIPIWCSCSVYAIVYSQPFTLFTKQGDTLDRNVSIGGYNIQIPPASLLSLITGFICLVLVIYDRIIVPICRRFSNNPSGLTMLQRIGTGMFISIFTMMVAAMVEAKRLQTAADAGIADDPTAIVPMSLWWLIPQYAIFGVSEAFIMVGLQEFFYDQMPRELKSLGLGIYLSIFGVGGFLSSFLIYVIDKVTAASGDSWFSDNLNKGHLDYFYWLVACLAAAVFLVYLHFARSYSYRQTV